MTSTKDELLVTFLYNASCLQIYGYYEIEDMLHVIAEAAGRSNVFINGFVKTFHSNKMLSVCFNAVRY